jgi:hypothetical protein
MRKDITKGLCNGKGATEEINVIEYDPVQIVMDCFRRAIAADPRTKTTMLHPYPKSRFPFIYLSGNDLSITNLVKKVNWTMDEKQYKEKIQALNEAHCRQLAAVHVEYAKSNNTVAKGDVVYDGHTRILVEEIRVLRSFGPERLPCCTYKGVMITNDGRPFKNGKKAVVWQPNIQEITKVDEQ